MPMIMSLERDPSRWELLSRRARGDVIPSKPHDHAVVMPEECQSIPMTAPKDWNQNGHASRRKISSRPYCWTIASVMTAPTLVIRPPSHLGTRPSRNGRSTLPARRVGKSSPIGFRQALRDKHLGPRPPPAIISTQPLANSQYNMEHRASFHSFLLKNGEPLTPKRQRTSTALVIPMRHTDDAAHGSDGRLT